MLYGLLDKPQPDLSNKTPNSMTPSIEVSGLSKTYKSAFSSRAVRALHNLDLTVQQGEIFGLLGPNGAGKTTLVKILLSVVHATKGNAYLYGVPVHNPAARQRIGFLPENHRFPDFLTANQMLDLYGQFAGVSAADRKERIPRLLDLVNMGQWGDTKIRKYSKGMMQRVGIAQALINDPDLIFLDEPTDGVDPIGRREIRDILLVLKEEGKTIFLNSHLLSEVEQMCTSVVILNKGEKVQEGSVEDLTRVETHFELYTTHVPDVVLAEIQQAFSFEPASENGQGSDVIHFRLSNADRAGLNAVIDTLRKSNIQIDEVRPFRKSLEERFVEVVKEEE